MKKETAEGYILKDELDGCRLGSNCYLCTVPQGCISDYKEQDLFEQLTDSQKHELIMLMINAGYSRVGIIGATNAPYDYVLEVWQEVKRPRAMQQLGFQGSGF